MHGMQVARALRVFPQCMPQQGHHPVEHARGDVAMAPDRVEDLVAAEHPSWHSGKEGEHAEGLGFQWLLDAAAQQPAAGEIDDRVVEG